MNFFGKLLDKVLGRKRKEPTPSEDDDPVLLSPYNAKRRKMSESPSQPDDEIVQNNSSNISEFASRAHDFPANPFLEHKQDYGLQSHTGNQPKSNLAPVRSLPRPALSPGERHFGSADFVPSAADTSSNLSSGTSKWPTFASPLHRLLPSERPSGDTAGFASPTSNNLFTKEQAALHSESPQQRIARSPLFANKATAPSIIKVIHDVGEALAYNELLEDAAPVTQQARLLRQQQQQQQSFWEAQQQSRVNESTSSDEVVIVQSTKATPAAVIDDDDYDSQMEKQRQMNEIARAYAELTVKYPDEVPEEYARVAVMLESPSREHIVPQPVFVSVPQSQTEAVVDRLASLKLLRKTAEETSKRNLEEAQRFAQEAEAKRVAERIAALSKRRRVDLITEAEKEQMAKSIVGPGPKTVVTNYDIDMKVEDFRRLQPGQWLNDEVINYYMEMLNERAKKNGVKLHCFSSMFYAMLSEKGYSYHRVQRWTRRIDVFSLDRVIAPIHLGNHWCLAVVNFKDKCFEYYDSLGGKNDRVLNTLRRWVQDDSLDKKKKEFDLTGFVDKMPGSSAPQQLNGFDCGVFACKFAECRARDEPFDFSQKDMPYFRMRMWLEILNKQLHSDYD